MYEIKQSTAETIPFFVHDLSGDAVTGLSDGSFTKRISKGSGAFAAMTVTISEMENGWYSIPLSATHSNTLGLLTIVFTNAGAKQVNLQWRVEAKLIDDLQDLTAAQVNTEVDTALTDYDGPTNAEMEARTLVAASYFDPAADTVATVTTVTNQLTSDAIADGVWDELLAGHTTADTAGLVLNEWQDGGRLDLILDARMAEASISTTGGAVDNVTLVATTTTNTDMVGTDNAFLAASAPTNFSDLAITVTTGRVSVGTSFDKTGYSISGTITTLDGLNNFDPTTDAVANVTLTATTTTLTGHTVQTGDSFARIGANGAALTDLGGMSTGMKAEVNTEMVDVMDTDTITLPGQTAPPLAPTHRQAIGWLFKSYRNKETQTATEYSLFDDAGSTVDAKATVSDDSTTFTKAEVETGP